MKKIMLLAVAALMATLSASAQHEPGKWSFDINIGLGASWLNNAEKAVLQYVGMNSQNVILDKQSAPSAFLGLGVTYQANKIVGLSAGVNYAVQGQGYENLKVPDMYAKYSNNALELTYVQIPLMAHLYFYKGWSFNTGVQPGFLVNADMTSRVERDLTRKQTDDIRVDYMDDLKKFDLTIPLGISYEFKGHFVLGAQYNLGLLPVNKKGNVYEDHETKNGAFYLTLGWKIGL